MSRILSTHTISRLALSILPIWAAFVLAGCSSHASQPAQTNSGAHEQPVIYGNDDRQDVYAFPDAIWAARAADSTMALLEPYFIDASNPNDIRFSADTLANTLGVCADERFADQISAAFCSGTLIAPDLVLTAGHCVTSQFDCNNTRLVFGYYMENAATMHTIRAADVFSCAELIVRMQDDAGPDYAILRLDRRAIGHTPALPRLANTAVSLATRLAVHGSPSGLPIKIDDNGAVRDARTATLDYFIATLDTFQGNSGSGVFDRATGELIGILARGEDDYVLDTANACIRPKRCQTDECSGEQATYAFRAIEHLCSTGLAPELCACGDGECNGAESPVNCPGDCSTCGNQICDATEDQSRCCMDCGCGMAGMECVANTCVPDPAAGDTCAAPIIVSSMVTYTAYGDTTSAADDYAGTCGGEGGRDQVYSFATSEILSVTAHVEGRDTVLYARSACTEPSPAFELACSTSGGPGPVLEWTDLMPGVYYLFVDGASPDSTGDYTLTVRFHPCTDTDSDGACDLVDECPTNPSKIEPGMCGCDRDEHACEAITGQGSSSGCHAGGSESGTVLDNWLLFGAVLSLLGIRRGKRTRARSRSMTARARLAIRSSCFPLFKREDWTVLLQPYLPPRSEERCKPNTLHGQSLQRRCHHVLLTRVTDKSPRRRVVSAARDSPDSW